MIQLEELLSNIKKEILINEEYSFDNNYLANTDILELSNVKAVGRIFKDSSEELVIDLDVNGEMIISDAVSFEPVKYPFSIKIDDYLTEFVTNIENTLDIMEVLWQNIVLEVPLRYTEVKDTSKLKGDGWQVISEEDKKSNNNIFSTLLESEEKE